MVDGEDRRVSGNRVSGVLASLESRCLFRLHPNNLAASQTLIGTMRGSSYSLYSYYGAIG